jgi:hypothetical protein
MTKTQVEVITSVQRRRRWSRADKERLVAAALEPGVVASEVAREAGIRGVDDPRSYRRTGLVGHRAHRHEEGLCQPVNPSTGGIAPRPAVRTSVLLPGPPRQPVEGDLARRPRCAVTAREVDDELASISLARKIHQA